MPASDTRDDQRGARVFSVLFWIGVALAPIAALIMLVGSGTTSLRVSVGVVILSVILIGVSITLRRDSEGLRTELEDTIFDEVDGLRADVRDDITHAAQATHRAFGEKLQYLLDQLEATRAELDATRAQVDVMRHGGAHQPPQQRHAAPAPAQAPQMAQGTARPGMPPGVVRHTETVQVTTRHTVMDPHDDGPRGTTYGTRVATPRGGGQQPHHEESWTDQRLREQFDRRRESEQAEHWRPRESYEERWPAPAPALDDDDDRRPGVRAGDRWASVRSDDRGRELRMGERRAAWHSDGSGTELRIEDRWAAVRREAGLGGQSWRIDDDHDRHDAAREFPYRDQDDRGRRAITGSGRDERWSDYRSDYDEDRGYERDYDRDYR